MSDESPATRAPRARATATNSENDTDEERGRASTERETPPSEGSWVDRSGPAARPSEVASTGEPDEFDPASLGPDPPSVSIPDPSDAEVPNDVARVFWSLVVVLNLAIFAVSIGALLVGFRGQWRVGGGLLVLGVVLFARAGQRYRRYQKR